MKSLHVSVEASLKKLRTNYIDLLYVHWWDWETSVEEVMNGLHNLVTQGKVLYLVRVTFFLSSSEKVFIILVGNFRYSSLDRLAGKHIREDGGQDAFRCLPGNVERHGSGSRARRHSDVQISG